MTLISEAPTVAPEATTTFATSRVGLCTHTRRTVTSFDPSPTVTCPSTKLVFEALISTAAEDADGSVVRLTFEITGAAAAG